MQMRLFFSVAVCAILTLLGAPIQTQAQNMSEWPGMREVMEFKGLEAQELFGDQMAHIRDAVLVNKGWRTTTSLGKPMTIDHSVSVMGGVEDDFGLFLLQNGIKPSDKPRAFQLSEGGFLVLVSERQFEFYFDLYLQQHG